MAEKKTAKIKSIFKDTVWSIAGLVLMNAAAQLLVYPYWDRVLGSEAYGNIVYLLAIMNVLAISIGIGVNYARMRRSAGEKTHNKPYLMVMGAGTVFLILVLVVLQIAGLLHIGIGEFLLFCILTIVTMWRYYADVEYRLHINYKGYFLYYLVIGIGYLLGMWLFKLTGLWPLALLPGEIAGLLLVFFRGTVFRKDKEDGPDLSPAGMRQVFRLAILLIGTNLLSHLIFNGDRIILQLFSGSMAVTVYYIASLFGKTMTLITTPLNGVLVGHLAKYKGKLSKKLMNQVTVVSLGVIILATVICVAASLVVLPVLYPADFEVVRQYLFLANAAQVVYFMGNVLMASILLRFTAARNQMVVNVVHGVLFVAVCIPAAWKLGIAGFCWGVLGVNLVRLGICIILGYSGTKEEKNHDN